MNVPKPYMTVFLSSVKIKGTGCNGSSCIVRVHRLQAVYPKEVEDKRGDELNPQLTGCFIF